MKRIKLFLLLLATTVAEMLRDANRALFDYMRHTGMVLATAPTTVQTMAGATLAISASIPATYDAAGYGATAMVYTSIGDVEDFGDHGVVAAVATFTPVATGVVAKRKGSKDYGEMNLKLGNIPSDSGQALLRTASESNNPYSVKMTYPSGEIHYISALVSSFQNNDGTVDNIQRVSVKLEIDRKPVIVAAV